jgi:hypothetical protein
VADQLLPTCDDGEVDCDLVLAVSHHIIQPRLNETTAATAAAAALHQPGMIWLSSDTAQEHVQQLVEGQCRTLWW